ncbi:MAG: transglycosylase domain-containing protein [Acidimicrobiales bacterium]
MRKLARLLVTISASGVLLAGAIVALIAPADRLARSVHAEAAPLDLAALDEFAVRSRVFAADGSLLATLHGPENRQPVPLSSVPQPVIDAILAVEDADFYRHNGVNFRAIGRALFENVSSGGVEQGGSTITQQLVKNALLRDPSRDLDRKTKEIPLAIRLEQQLSKDEILERYLNAVYFGSGAYGVQAAAETYWGVGVEQLGYAEGAMLAALIANPEQYDPIRHPERAYEQRRAALDRLVALGKISREDAVRYGSAPLPVNRCSTAGPRPAGCGDGIELPPPENYFVENVKQQLLADPRLGATRDERIERLFGGGLRIFTTLDPKMQLAAELAHAQGVPRNSKGVTAAIVTVENSTGAVRALVGGPGYDQYKYDVATHQPGQPTGSAFKVFTLLTALEQGNLPSDTIGGGGAFKCPGCSKDPYVVSGAGGTLTSVTARSSNGAFVRLAQVVGIPNVVETARKLGVTSELPPVLSLTLGPREITPLEMASAYSTIPNDGVRVPPYFIERVEDANGRVIFEHEPGGEQAISERSACYAREILQEVVKSGTGTRARLSKQPVGGKTGTAEENFDAWFVGFTPYFTTAIWMGNPDQDVSMANLNGVANFGGTYPAMIWRAFNEVIHQGLPVGSFAPCPKPDRSGRPVVGRGDNALNGVRIGKDGKPIFGTVPGMGSTSSSSSTTIATGSASTTTTTATPEATTPSSTAPPSTATAAPPGG